jgi:glutamyl-tRNA reductase
MIADIVVYHQLKNQPGFMPLQNTGAFYLDTCQRQLLVTVGHHALGIASAKVAPYACVNVYKGADAYEFLLNIACGLESRMVGETEVLGQFKDAWRRYVANDNGAGDSWQMRALEPIFQKLFEDIKTIRSRYLQNLGQGSYGSQVRRLLNQARLRRPTVVVGAGAFAESILPWLSGQEVWLTNRSLHKARALADKLEGCFDAPGPFFGNPIRVVAPEEAFSARAHLVLAVPGTSQDMGRWAAAAALLAPQGLVIFDLGEPAVLSAFAPGSGLQSSATIVTLNDLYEEQRKYEQVRDIEVAKARRAIEELALKRVSQESITHIHGWEDLWQLP